MQDTPGTVAVLATGGTIAGTAASATDNIGYSAAQLGVQALVDAVPALAGVPLVTDRWRSSTQGHGLRGLGHAGRAWRISWRSRASPAWSSRTAPIRWKKPPIAPSACWRRQSRWCWRRRYARPRRCCATARRTCSMP